MLRTHRRILLHPILRIVFVVLIIVLLAWNVTRIAKADSVYIVDADTNVGVNALAIINGNPASAYYDVGSQSIKLALCSNAACETGTSTISTVVTSDPSVSALVLTSVGVNPIIIYSNATQLKAVACVDPICNSPAVITLVSALTTTGRVHDVTIINGKPLIVFTQDFNPGTGLKTTLKTAACVDAQCSTPATITSLFEDSSASWGNRFRVTFTNNYPVISLLHAQKLKVAVCANLSCTGIPYWRNLTSEIFHGDYLSMTLAGANPVIVYRNGQLQTKAVACVDPTCASAPTVSTITSIISPSSIANINGTLMIASTSGTGSNSKPELSTCADQACTAASTVIIPVVNDDQRDPQLVNVDGFPAISYLVGMSPSRLHYYYGGNYVPVSSPTPSPLPSNTPSPVPTLTYTPSNTPRPTYTPSPTYTPYPTMTPLPPLPTPFASTQIVKLASNVYVGESDMKLDSQGIPVIAFADWNKLTLVRCNNATTCDAPIINVVDGAGSQVGEVALVLDQNNIAVIAYYEYVYGALKLARCNSVACDQPTITTIDGSGVGATSISMTIDQYDTPIIVYNDSLGGSNSVIRLVRCNSSTNCTAPTFMTFSDPNISYQSYERTKVMLRSNGIPVIGYRVWADDEIKVAHCNSTTSCTSPTISIIAEADFFDTLFSMGLDSAGVPVLSYTTDVNGSQPRSLQVWTARCNSATVCNAPAKTVMDNVLFYYSSGAMTLNAAGLPFVAYMEGRFKDVRLALCTEVACNNPLLVPVDSTDMVGEEVAIAVDAGNRVFVAYSRTPDINMPDDLMLFIGGPFTHPPTPTPVPSSTPITPEPTSTMVTPTSLPDASPPVLFFTVRHPTLTWNMISWAQAYQIQIDDDPNFGSPITDEVDADTLSYTTEATLPDGLYYWQVRAKQSETEWGDWSVTETIIVSA